jgi:hypothetical protein
MDFVWHFPSMSVVLDQVMNFFHLVKSHDWLPADNFLGYVDVNLSTISISLQTNN